MLHKYRIKFLKIDENHLVWHEPEDLKNITNFMATTAP